MKKSQKPSVLIEEKKSQKPLKQFYIISQHNLLITGYHLLQQQESK